MDDDLVAHGDALDALADGVDDSRRIAAAEMEVVRVAAALALRDHVDGCSPGGPDVVEVDARGHHGDEHLAGAGSGRVDLLDLEGGARITEAVLAHELGEHAGRNLADGWQGANGDCVTSRCHRTRSLCSGLRPLTAASGRERIFRRAPAVSVLPVG